MMERLKVLLIEDDADDVVLAQRYLNVAFGRDRYVMDHVATIHDALKRLEAITYDVFLVDYHLAGESGIDFTRRAIEEYEIAGPVILLTGQREREVDVEAMEAGATDYLVKQDIDGQTLERSIRYAIRQKKSEVQIQYLAYHDMLTDLPNRTLLGKYLTHALARVERHPSHGAVLFLDVDNFKGINDSLGHSVGDALLVEVAARLRESTRSEDNVSRLGGDEFIILLGELSCDPKTAATQARTVAEKIRIALNQPMVIEENNLHIGVSIGVNLFADHKRDQDTILKQADTAMYEAKASGRNTVCFFHAAMEENLRAQLSLEELLRKAITGVGFSLHYQPQVETTNGRMTGAEALLRLQGPDGEFIAPTPAIELAEQRGLINELGELVFKTAFRQLAEFADIPKVAINVSAKQFHAPSFFEQVQRLMDDFGVDPTRIKLELTETAMIDDLDDTAVKMKKLKDLGIDFALDDFGTGYSSLTYLKRLPFDVLKIDRSFVTDSLHDEADANIVAAVVTLGQALNLSLVGEGVETEGHMDFLRDKGVFAAQGYFISRPLPADGLVTWASDLKSREKAASKESSADFRAAAQ